MPAPTPDGLYDYFTALIAEKQPPGKHAVFEFEYLLRCGFRHFRSSSPAVRSRMKTLVEEGRLAPVEIGSGGHVYLDKENAGLHLAYFQYCNPSGYAYGPEEYGFITARRSRNHSNVWRDGMRRLYTTDVRHGELTEYLRQDRIRRSKEAKEQAAREQERLWTALEAAFPGARVTLDELRDALGTATHPSSELDAKLVEVRGKDQFWVEANARGDKAALVLLDVIRRGLDARKGSAGEA